MGGGGGPVWGDRFFLSVLCSLKHHLEEHIEEHHSLCPKNTFQII
jgi:hypothetical protein